MTPKQIEKQKEFVKRQCDKFEGILRAKGVATSAILWQPFDRVGLAVYTGTTMIDAVSQMALGLVSLVEEVGPNPVAFIDEIIKLLQEEKQKLLDTRDESNHTTNVVNEGDKEKAQGV